MLKTLLHIFKNMLWMCRADHYYIVCMWLGL